MKKVLLVISLISVLLFTGCSNNVENNNLTDNQQEIDNKLDNKNEWINDVDYKRNIGAESDIEFLDNLYGVYGEWGYNAISVFPGKDDNHIDVGYYQYRSDAFYINDVNITKMEGGAIEASKVISEDDGIYRDSSTEQLKLDVLIKDDTIKLTFNGNVLMYGDKTQNTVMEEKKDGGYVITEEQKQKALNLVKDGMGQYVNNKVFEIVEDSTQYLVLRVTCYIYDGEDEGKYHIEGSESIGMYKYYNFDKKNKKFVNLSDLTGGSYTKLNEYIKTAIESKKQGWIDGTDKQWNVDGYSTVGTEWPYWEMFNGIGNPDYFENYFLIDEGNKVVKIRCLSYPDEATRAYGDICIDVPFSIFENIG